MVTQPPQHGKPRSSSSIAPWLVGLSVVLAMALIASVVFISRARSQAAELDAEVDVLQDQVLALQDLVERQQEQLDESTGQDAVPPNPAPQGSTNDGLDGGLEELLEGDLGTVLEDLLGGGLGELDGLLGESSDLLGGADPTALAACVAGGELGDLFTSGAPLTGSLDDQVAEIARRVADLRQLEFATEVTPTFLDDAAFADRVADTVRDEYPAEQADLDSRMLAVLGAVPFGTDLLDVQADLLAGQVAGFYDPDTGELVVPDNGDNSLDAMEQIILAHELDHALTDQALGLPDVDATDDSDGNLAGIALVEGDATLLMQQYSTENLSLFDQLGQLSDPNLLQSQQQLNDVAPYLRNELSFPYASGLGYVCDSYADGSWDAVNAEYRSLPRTTAEILFPERGAVTIVPPSDLGDPGRGWEVTRTDTIGAAQLLWLFEAPGGNETAALDNATEAVRAWSGGTIVVATRGGDTAVGMALTDGSGSGTLCTAVDAWYDASFGDDARSTSGSSVTFDDGRQTAALACVDGEVRLGIAPDLATATALIG